MPTGFCDVAMAYNPDTRKADVVFDGTRFVIDRTAATPLIISLGTEGRAAPDDVLPDTVDAADVYAGGVSGRPNPKRGWVGDAIDPNGRRIGCKVWLLANEHQTADTRLRAAGYAQAGIGWMSGRGVIPVADASWIQPGVLAVLANVAGIQLKLPVSLV